MASAILATVKPVNGLNTLVLGTPIGALFAGSVFMTVTTTGAISLAVADALGKSDSSERVAMLIVLTLLVGVIQLALGLLRLGWITKFVSNSVMVGFITGVCILIILGQLGDLTGYSSEYSNKVAKTVDLLFHLGEIDWPTLAVGLATIGLILLLDRTAVRKFSMVLAFAAATVGVRPWSGSPPWPSSADIASDPVEPAAVRACPTSPTCRSSSSRRSPSPLIGLVQGAGVSKSVPNPDGTYGDASRDFVAQGAANAVMGFFSGMPMGGSVSASALNVSSGARSRWANVYAGVIVAVVLLLFGSYVEKVPLPTVAALLIVAAAASLKPDAFMEVWRTNWASRIIMLFTLALTLAVPIQYAVLAGVVVSTLQHISARRSTSRSAGSCPRRGRLSGRGAAGAAARRRCHHHRHLRQRVLRGHRRDRRQLPEVARHTTRRAGRAPARARRARQQRHRAAAALGAATPGRWRRAAPGGRGPEDGRPTRAHRHHDAARA